MNEYTFEGTFKLENGESFATLLQKWDDSFKEYLMNDEHAHFTLEIGGKQRTFVAKD